MRRGRLRWFGHLERRSVDDWVSACRKVEVAGARCKGRKRKTWKESVDKDMKMLGLHPEWVVFRDVWRDFVWANVSTLLYSTRLYSSVAWKKWTFSK